MRLEHLIQAAFERYLSENVFVASVGKVLSYDPATCTADVQPGAKRPITPTAPGQPPVFETPAPCRSVRVVWLGGGSFGVHAPLAEGDPVLLVFCDFDPAAFFRTGQVVQPDDVRPHDAANAVAIPCFTRPAHANGSTMTAGHTDAPVKFTSSGIEVDGASQSAALAAKLDVLGQTIAVVTPPTDLGTLVTAVGLILTAFDVAWPGGVGTVASTKLKAGG